jgi:hypothetical protein
VAVAAVAATAATSTAAITAATAIGRCGDLMFVLLLVDDGCWGVEEVDYWVRR